MLWGWGVGYVCERKGHGFGLGGLITTTMVEANHNNNDKKRKRKKNRKTRHDWVELLSFVSIR